MSESLDLDRKLCVFYEEEGGGGDNANLPISAVISIFGA